MELISHLQKDRRDGLFRKVCDIYKYSLLQDSNDGVLDNMDKPYVICSAACGEMDPGRGLNSKWHILTVSKGIYLQEQVKIINERVYIEI